MEFCSQGSLSKTIKKRGTLTWERKLELLLHIAKGMRFLHQSNIIHRDLKAENVLIDAAGVCKIADFGVSTTKGNTRMTNVVGTQVYMAPEVVLNEFYDERCDVFSFAILMFEVLVETINPYGKNESMNIHLSVSKNPAMRPMIPVDFDITPNQEWFIDLMHTCWKHNAANRKPFAEIVEILQRHIAKGLFENELDDQQQLGVGSSLSKTPTTFALLSQTSSNINAATSNNDDDI